MKRTKCYCSLATPLAAALAVLWASQSQAQRPSQLVPQQEGPRILLFGGASQGIAQNGTFLFFPDASPQQLQVADQFYFPQFATGTVGDVRFQSALFLGNTGADALLDIAALGRDGNPLTVDLGSLGNGSLFQNVALRRGQSLSLETSGGGGIRVGYLVVTVKREAASAQAAVTGAGVGGTLVFTRSEAGSGIILTEAGVPATREVTGFSLLLDSRGARDIGLALLYPRGGQSSPRPARVYRLTVRSTNFSQVLAGPIEVTLQEGQGFGKFIWEIFRDAGAPAGTVALLQETEGIVSVEGTGAAITIRQNDNGMPFPLQVPTLTTFPVLEGATP